MRRGRLIAGGDGVMRPEAFFQLVRRSPQTALIANKKPAEGGLEILMVAGAGFEPATN